MILRNLSLRARQDSQGVTMTTVDERPFYQLLFSFEGRVPRAYLWFTLFVVVFAGTALIVVGEYYLGLKQARPLVMLVALWIFTATNVKRWHDINASGWWAALQFIPLANLAALFINVFIKGTSGPNDYGPDPLWRPAQPLTVACPKCQAQTQVPASRLLDQSAYTGFVVASSTSTSVTLGCNKCGHGFTQTISRDLAFLK